jgi:hypothetical protein
VSAGETDREVPSEAKGGVDGSKLEQGQEQEEEEEVVEEEVEEEAGPNLIDVLLEDVPLYGMQPGRGLSYADLHYGAMDAELVSPPSPFFLLFVRALDCLF